MQSKEELKELRGKSSKELLAVLKNNYEELRKLRFQVKIGELKDFNKIKNTKKKIARLLTILREKFEDEAMEATNEKEIKRRSGQR